MKTILLFTLLLIINDVLAQDIFQSLRVDDRRRSMIIHVPENFDGNQEYPLVINMHGFLMNASQQKNYTEFNDISDKEGVFVVYPQGQNKRWNSGEFFGVKSKIDDVAFVEAIIDFMALKYKIDTKRVYATGYSAGGFMSYKLACDLSQRIAAIAPVASSMTAENFDNCYPLFDVPILAMNGTSDPVTIYSGFVSVTSIPKVMGLWSNKFNCQTTPVVELLPNTNVEDKTQIEKIYYADCNENVDLIFYKINNGGHTWPGAKPFPIVGNTNYDISGNNEIWNFFKDKTVNESATCDSPIALEAFNLSEHDFRFSWENDFLENDYDLFLYNEEEIQAVESISGGSVDVNVNLSGVIKWAIRSECPSGYVSWSHGDEIVLEEGKLEVPNSLKLFPNPVINEFTINSSALATGEYEVVITNLLGTPIFSAKRIVESEENIKLDVSALKHGSYLIRLQNKNDVFSAQFFKE